MCSSDLGIERLILLLETLEQVPEEISRQVDVYLCAFGEAAELAALTLSEKVRDQLPNLRLQINAGEIGRASCRERV